MTPRTAAEMTAAAGALVSAAGMAAGWFGVGVVGLVLAATVAIAGLSVTMRGPAPLRPRVRAPEARPDPAHVMFERLSGAVAVAQRGPRWADTSLRPHLARTADTLLLAHAGYHLRDNPEGARQVLGDALFQFVDPTRAARGHDDGPGLTVDELAEMIRRLESLT